MLILKILWEKNIVQKNGNIVILNKDETFFYLKYFHSKKHLSQFSQRNNYMWKNIYSIMAKYIN